MRGGSRGVILPLLLFLLLALTLLAQGTLLLTRRELEASLAFLHAMRGREAARSALWDAMELIPLEEGGPGAPGEETEILDQVAGDGTWGRVSLRWLGPELFFLEGKGGSKGWPGVQRLGAVGWRLDPLARMAALRGWVEIGGQLRLQGEGATSTGAVLDPPLGWNREACASDRVALASIFHLNPIPLASRIPAEVEPTSASTIPALGFLDGVALLAEGGEGAAGKWGGPEEVTGPGAGCPGNGLPLFRGVQGSLELGEGWRCGLLVVEGDLVLKGAGIFQGVVLVGGDLRLEGNWILQGMARVGGSVEIQGRGRFDASACAATLTLRGIEELREPLILPGAASITPF